MHKKCTDCGSDNISTHGSEDYCRDCGAVLDDQKVDSSREYRAFSGEEKSKKERVGSSVTYTQDDKGMGGQMGTSVDMNQIPGSMRGRYYRMKKWDKRSQKRGARDMLNFVQSLISDLGLPESVAEESGRLCFKARDLGIVKGRSKEVVSASVVYLVARNNGVPRTVAETADALGVKEKVLAKNYRYVAREMDLGIKPINPKKLLPRFANKLDMDGSTRAEVREVISEAVDRNFTVGSKPASVVAGAIYHIVDRDDLDLIQRDIASACDVTTVTVRNHSQKFEENLSPEENTREVSVKNA